MTAGRVTLCIALAIGTAACSDDDPYGGASPSGSTTSTTATTAPERDPSTTTTEFDPATVEGEVEAAYLRSWDVYADAVYDLELDEEALAEVYAEKSLENLITEIEERIDKGRASFVRVEHNYDITVSNPTTAVVVDSYRNHQVVVDPETKEPTEPDPNNELVYAFTLRLSDVAWRVVLIQKVSS